MPLTINLVPSTNPISLFPRNLLNTSTIFHTPPPPSPSTLRPLVVKCSASENGGGFKDSLGGIVGDQVEELLNKQENRVLLDGLVKASERVENAKRELAEIERQEHAAKLAREYINELETRASEIEECQKEISGAKAKVEEAERALSQTGDEFGNGYASAESENGEIDKDQEKLESIKAASVAAIVGAVAGLPFSFTQVSNSSELILPLGITSISCALFGVTFRYAIRRDLENSHLKTGAPAAFGVVKGLAMLDGGKPLELNTDSLISHAFDGAVYVSENLFVFLSAAVALDYLFKMRLLSPFPIKKSVSRSNTR
ncbi:uncharacterized protein LOC126794138 [Argentina anserina]|uniref:uncharacterized protein LOC126794138 n=1 Tax=Argentina anserina TaxID=57926 RepID=UPI002176928C|nr:uncharacterized protein LOC126794138 [Potentilla anserina]